MSRTRNLKKITLPIKDLQEMNAEHRAAILALGMFLNEANWLRKLLVTATYGISDTPEGKASFSLTAFMAAMLAGKIHEGWKRIRTGPLCETVKDFKIPHELDELRKKLEVALMPESTIHKIRNYVAFHYPRKMDFDKLTHHIDDTDTAIFISAEGYSGDVLSCLSTLAGIEPLIAISDEKNYLEALEEIWNEITEIAEVYCKFMCELQALLISNTLPNTYVEDVSVEGSPNSDEIMINFFSFPPNNLNEIQK